MSSTPFVSIIIPCKEMDSLTAQCIEYCKHLDYPNFEIIVLPDYSVNALEKEIVGFKIIPTGPVAPGVKRNVGIKTSTGEFCAFIDNDAYPRRDWLINSLNHLKETNVGGVGGPGITPKEDGFMQQAGGYVLSSFMVGNLSSRYKNNRCFESEDIHSCNFVARKSVLEAAGGWNEKYWPGEDTLMSLAIRKSGKKLIESFDIVVFHHRRSLFKPHLKQMSRFGEHRGFFAKKFPENSKKLIYFFPSLFMLYLMAGLVVSLAFSFFLYILLFSVISYFSLSLIAAAVQVKSVNLIISIWVGIIVTHLVYGLFFLSGLFKRELER